MGQLSRKLRSFDGGFMHWCPACDGAHGIYITKPNPCTNALWTWNGDAEAPTVQPSVRCFTTNDEHGNKLPNNQDRTTCHYHLTAGMISFCGDCPHALAGQTVPLPDWDD